MKAVSGLQSSESDLSRSVDQKYESLRTIVSELESAVVAFSGGVDSTLLLKVALDVLGTDNVLAVTADSETYPVKELEAAGALARTLGAQHRVVKTEELSIPGYSANDRNRCYFCRHNLFEYLLPIRRETGYRHLIYGLIADDMGDFRPGIRAAIEKGVRGPLQEAHFTKDDVRILSRRLGLSTWNKPALACLSSRVAFGEVITREKLRMIDDAEEYIRGLGIEQVRVRTHGPVARIEVEPQDIERIVTERVRVFEELKRLGYKYVTLDLAGYQSGSMNRELQ